MVNVGLLDHQQAETDPARTFISSELAKEMTRRLMAERLSKRLYRLFGPESPFPQIKRNQSAERFIPEKLPPREAPGCFFQLPQSDRWKRDHRTVTFMARA